MRWSMFIGCSTRRLLLRRAAARIRARCCVAPAQRNPSVRAAHPQERVRIILWHCVITQMAVHDDDFPERRIGGRPCISCFSAVEECIYEVESDTVFPELGDGRGDDVFLQCVDCVFFGHPGSRELLVCLADADGQ